MPAFSEEGDRENEDNKPTHQEVVSKSEVYEYRGKSRYWKHTDP